MGGGRGRRVDGSGKEGLREGEGVGRRGTRGEGWTGGKGGENVIKFATPNESLANLLGNIFTK